MTLGEKILIVLKFSWKLVKLDKHCVPQQEAEQ